MIGQLLDESVLCGLRSVADTFGILITVKAATYTTNKIKNIHEIVEKIK